MDVLLVEDDPSQARTIQKTLEAEDWSVEVAGTVEEAVEALEGDPPDVAIVDYRLPDGDGLDVLETSKREAPGTPVLFITGTGDEEVALQALSRGAARYLVKGGDTPAELPDAVRGAVESWSGITPVEVVETADKPTADPESADERPLTTTATVEDGSLEEFVHELVEPPVLGLGVYDDKGSRVAASLPDDVDESAPGVLAAAASHQMEGLASVFDLDIEGQVLLARGGNGVLGLTVVPGPLVVVLLLDPAVDREVATDRLFRVAAEVWERAD